MYHNHLPSLSALSKDRTSPSTESYPIDFCGESQGDDSQSNESTEGSGESLDVKWKVGEVDLFLQVIIKIL